MLKGILSCTVRYGLHLSRVLLCTTLVLGLNSAQSATKTSHTQTSILSISGLIDASEPVHFSYETLKKLPHHQVATSTVVTDGIIHFEGVLMRDLLASVGATGKVVAALALNGYTIDIPIEDATDYDVLVAWSANGNLLDPKTKGPLWIIYPRDHFRQLQDMRYDYRWVWQLHHLTVK